MPSSADLLLCAKHLRVAATGPEALVSVSKGLTWAQKSARTPVLVPSGRPSVASYAEATLNGNDLLAYPDLRLSGKPCAGTECATWRRWLHGNATGHRPSSWEAMFLGGYGTHTVAEASLAARLRPCSRPSEQLNRARDGGNGRERQRDRHIRVFIYFPRVSENISPWLSDSS